MSSNNFNIWIAGCPHAPEDNEHGRKSIADAIHHVESEMSFLPDIGFILGDFSSSQEPVDLKDHIKDGLDIASQLCSGKLFTRNRIYCTTGNHDAGNGNYDWYNRFVDDFGNNPAWSGVFSPLRPYHIAGTETQHYKIETGNITWLVMYDQNDGPNPCGRGSDTSGYPSGSVLASTYEWWEKEMLSAFENKKNPITLCHYLLKDTTIATGDFEGVEGKFHSGKGQPRGSGRLHNILIDKAANIYEKDQSRFKTFLTQHKDKRSLWFGTHTHYTVGQTFKGRGWSALVDNCYFFSVGSLGKFHTNLGQDPQSATLSFETGKQEIKIRKFVHSEQPGFVNEFETDYLIDYPFQW
jgi:hypothetical protein